MEDEDADAKALSKAGVDLLFIPTVDEIYPDAKFELTQSAGPIGKVYEIGRASCREYVLV